MAATLGMLVQENYHYTGYLSPSAGLKFEDVPNGLAALDVVPLAGWVQMVVLIGMHEVLVKQRPGRKPGDFGTGTCLRAIVVTIGVELSLCVLVQRTCPLSQGSVL